MIPLKGRQDGFRLLLPKDFICDEINEKYTKILQSHHSFMYTPIDFLNESIQKVSLLGFQQGTIQQQQTNRGKPIIDTTRTAENDFLHTASEYTYRSETSPINLIDKTLNVEFRHTLGYLNYFIIFENFFYQYARDRKYEELPYNFNIDILNEKGSIYAKVVLFDPIINGIDAIEFDNTQPIANSQSFRVEFKYSNFDYQFIEYDANTAPLDITAG